MAGSGGRSRPLATAGAGRRRGLLAAAVLVVALAGGAGVPAVATRHRTVLTPAASGLVPPASDPSSSTDQTDPPAPADPLAGTTGWYLPGYVPDGYELIQVQGGRASRAPMFGRRWVRLDPATGAVTASLNTRALAPQPGEPFDVKQTRGLTVHGLPAQVQVQDSGAISVFWVEQGMFAQITTHGLDRADTLVAAEAVVVDPSNADATFAPDAIPLGFDVPTPDGSAPPGAVAMGVDLSNGDGFATVSIGSRPNYDGDTLDTLAAAIPVESGLTTERRTFDGIDLLVSRSNVVDGHGTMRTATRLDSGMILTVTGRLGADEIAEVITGLQPASAADVLAAGRAVTARTLTMEALDQATMADGTRLTVRTDGRGATAVCVEAPYEHCKRQLSESSLVGDVQATIVGVFDDAGRTTVYWWSTSAEIPTLVPSSMIGASPTTTATITDTVRTAAGTFVQVDVPAGETPPSFRLGQAEYGPPPVSPIDY
ncbi:MAG: hypothetical protein QM733_02490 [Ilumatobacteraceae bacterium]